MDGDIGLSSEVDRGSTFWFTARLEKRTVDERNEQELQRETAGARVLCVDDNAINRRILERQIAVLGLDVESAESGTAALAVLRRAQSESRRFGLVLLDMQMPDMDGIALAREVDADPDLTGTPMILLTSTSSTLGTEQLAAIGIRARLTKPARHSQLTESVLRVLARSRAPEAEVESPTPVLPHRVEPGSKGHILLVEDNPVNERVATRMLERLGYRVDVAENGIEALATSARTAFDLILMDCQMPEMDGFETSRALREREGGDKHTPIVAMTANAMQGDRDRCLRAGMDDYIAKPVLMSDLEAVLERWTKTALPRGAQGSGHG